MHGTGGPIVFPGTDDSVAFEARVKYCLVEHSDLFTVTAFLRACEVWRVIMLALPSFGIHASERSEPICCKVRPLLIRRDYGG